MSSLGEAQGVIQDTFSIRQTEIPKSFKTLASEMETEFIKSAWKSVELMGGVETFEEVWQKFLLVLEKLDIP